LPAPTIESRAKRLLLLNPDTLILDDAIDRLFAFAENTPILGIWRGRTVFADGSLNPKSCWRQMTIWSVFCTLVGLSFFRSSPVFYSEGYGGWPRNTVRRVDLVTGCFFLIDRDLWERLCGFDPTFFMYGEEADLCLRAATLGAKPTVTPDRDNRPLRRRVGGESGGQDDQINGREDDVNASSLEPEKVCAGASSSSASRPDAMAHTQRRRFRPSKD
jgi:hypothetical protein